MYGEDSCGRKVSLLNDTPITTNNTHPPSNHPTRSRTSTSSSSSCTSHDRCNSSRSASFSRSPPSRDPSPPTPPLVRLDCQSSPSQSIPSPMTPQSYGFEPMDSQKQSTNPNSGHNHNNFSSNAVPYYTNNFAHRTNGHSYPSMQDMSQQSPYYGFSSQQAFLGVNDYVDDPFSSRTTLQPLQTQLANQYNSNNSDIIPTPSSVNSTTTPSLPPPSQTIQTDPTPTSATSATSTSAGAANTNSTSTPTTKKKYPCPHSARFNCADTFTTSGHAARHGKKHTGEKNILCPTCNKAFTRKDNMKQHERTHKIGTKSSNSVAGSPIIGARGSRRPSASAGGDPMELDVNDAAGGLNIGGAGFTKRPRMRSELSEIMEGLDRENGVLRGEEDMDADGEGESPGLDALATAASEMV